MFCWPVKQVACLLPGGGLEYAEQEPGLHERRGSGLGGKRLEGLRPGAIGRLAGKEGMNACMGAPALRWRVHRKKAC